MPPPKDPIKRQEWIKNLSDSHKGQIPWMKGRKHTPESLLLQRNVKLGNTYKRGKKLSPEGIENNRRAHLGLPSGFKGKTHKPESNQKNSEKHLGKPSPRKGAVLSEYTKSLVREARLHQNLPRKDTKIEKIMQTALTLNNINFEKHKPIMGQPDIFLEPNICIFVDGDYFHANPEKYAPEAIIFKKTNTCAKKIWAKDLRVTNTLLKQGYQVFRFWGSEIETNVQNCILKLK